MDDEDYDIDGEDYRPDTDDGDNEGLPHRRSPGRRPFVPTDEQRLMVQILVANGVPQDVIARNVHRVRGDLGISEVTLRKVFRNELDHGYSDTLARMGGTMVREGLKGSYAHARYWLTTHGGDEWKETSNVRHGLTPDTPRDAFSANAPVLVIQPVRAIDVDAEDKPLVPLEHEVEDDRPPSVDSETFT